MKLDIPMLPPSTNILRRKYRHPMAYRRLRLAWQDALVLAAGASSVVEHLREQGKQRVKMEIVVFHKRLYDDDNLAGSVKLVLDAAKNVKYITDDTQEWLEHEVTQHKSNVVHTEIYISGAPLYKS